MVRARDLTAVLAIFLVLGSFGAASHASDGSHTTNNYNYSYSYDTEMNQYLSTTNIDNSTQYHMYDQTTNNYQFDNTYYETNNYVYYYYGDNCPESGCQYVCSTPQCADRSRDQTQDETPLSQGVDLELTEVIHSSKIRPGEEVQFQVQLTNRGELNADNLRIAVNAYGQEKVLRDLTLNSGETQTFTLPFTMPQSASGPENVQITAQAINQQGNVMEQDITSIPVSATDIHMSMHLSPQRVTTGDLVEVRGMTSEPNMKARLYIGGFYITTVQSDETRHYSHTVKAQNPGFYRVELRSGNVHKTSFLRIDPRVGFADVNAPETVSTQGNFEACMTVTRATDGPADYDIRVDGQSVKQGTVLVQNGETRECVTLAITERGQHKLTFRVSADGATSTETKQVRAIESKIEVNVFPQRLTLENGRAGMFQVKIVNEDIRPRTFHLSTRGLDAITEATDKTVTVRSGETRLIHLRVAPRDVGLYRGNISVTSDDFVYADTQAEVYSTENPKLKGPLYSAKSAAKNAVAYVRANGQEIVAGLVAILVLVAIGVFLYRQTQQEETIKPRR